MCLAFATMTQAGGKGIKGAMMKAGLTGGAFAVYPLLGHMVTYPHVYHRNMYRTFDTALSTLGYGHNHHASRIAHGVSDAIDGITHAVDSTLKSHGLG